MSDLETKIDQYALQYDLRFEHDNAITTGKSTRNQEVKVTQRDTKLLSKEYSIKTLNYMYIQFDPKQGTSIMLYE